MTRERLARRALAAWPPDVRADRGEEMLATLLDASAGSGARFARELADLVRLGLRTRAARTAGAGPARLVADGLCLAGAWLMTVDLVTLLCWRARGVRDPLLAWPSIALLAAALALALVGYDRLAGAGAIAWTALRLPDLLVHHPGLAGLGAEAIPLLCLAAMVLAPRRRRADPARLAWLLVVVVLVATFGAPKGEQSPLLLVAVALAALAAVAFAVAMLPTDPRMAIAGAVGLSDLAVGAVDLHAPTVVGLVALGAGPAVVAFAVARTRRLRRAGVV